MHYYMLDFKDTFQIVADDSFTRKRIQGGMNRKPDTGKHRRAQGNAK